MKTYFAIISNNNQTEVITVNAANLTNAKIEAAKSGLVVCITLDKGSKIYF
jgi:hypothetical protein